MNTVSCLIFSRYQIPIYRSYCIPCQWIQEDPRLNSFVHSFTAATISEVVQKYYYHNALGSISYIWLMLRLYVLDVPCQTLIGRAVEAGTPTYLTHISLKMKILLEPRKDGRQRRDNAKSLNSSPPSEQSPSLSIFLHRFSPLSFDHKVMNQRPRLSELHGSLIPIVFICPFKRAQASNGICFPISQWLQHLKICHQTRWLSW